MNYEGLCVFAYIFYMYRPYDIQSNIQVDTKSKHKKIRSIKVLGFIWFGCAVAYTVAVAGKLFWCFFVLQKVLLRSNNVIC